MSEIESRKYMNYKPLYIDDIICNRYDTKHIAIVNVGFVGLTSNFNK